MTAWFGSELTAYLHDIQTIPKIVHRAVVSRIKTMSRLDIAEKRRPQDGRVKTKRADKEIELRVSTLPIAFGEKVVLRIFDPDVLIQDSGKSWLLLRRARSVQRFHQSSSWHRPGYRTHWVWKDDNALFGVDYHCQ